MSETTETLRAEFLRRQAAGEPMPRAPLFEDKTAGSCTLPRKPSAPAVPIDRNAKPDKQLGEIVRALAQLIPGWEYQPAGKDDYSDWGQLTRSDGAGVYFRNDSGRIEVAGEWPRAKNQGQMFSPNSYQATEYSRITVALKRSAEAIAADIERRFLPGYLSEYTQKVEQRDEYDRKTQAQTEITQRLAAIVGAEYRSGYNPWHPGEVADTFYGPTNCALRKCVVQYDGEAELEIRCDELTAAKILHILNGARDAG